VVLNKFCKRYVNAENTEKPKKHKESNVCNINFQDDSGGMETAGAVAQFTFFVEIHGVRHTKYEGVRTTDGTRKYQKQDLMGRKADILECIEHVQRLVGKIT
jgi:hypothetical protein